MPDADRAAVRFAGEALVAASRMATDGTLDEARLEAVQAAVLRAGADAAKLTQLLGDPPAFADPVAAREAVMFCAAVLASSEGEAKAPEPERAPEPELTNSPSADAEDEDWAVVDLASQVAEGGEFVLADWESHAAPAAERLADADRQAAFEATGEGWEGLVGVTAPTRALLRRLETEGVLYPRHDVAYRAKYLDKVPPLGDCLFLSVAAILRAEAALPGGSSLPALDSRELRRRAVGAFLALYSEGGEAQRRSFDQRIRNLYSPDLRRGWGVSQQQATYYVLPLAQRDELLARRLQLVDQGAEEVAAAEQVYKRAGEPVADAASYAKMMGVAGGPGGEHFVVAFHYTELGLHSVDDGHAEDGDPRPTWGDDLMIEVMSALFRREIFVVLASAALPDAPVDTGSVLFLSHAAEQLRLPGAPRWRAPWFLLMRGNSVAGGDHYDPLLAAPGMGAPSAFEPLDE